MAKTKDAPTAVIPATPGIGGPVIIPDSGPVHALTPYVNFTAGNAAYAKALPFCPGLSQGDPVLFRAAPHTPLHLDPMRFFLVHSKVHYTESDDRGNILRATFDKEVAAEDTALIETVEALILVVVGDTLIPARCTTRKGYTKCFWAAINAYKEALEDPDKWAAKSPEHRATLAVQDVRFRYSVSVKMLLGNTSRGKGFKYGIADGIIKPSTVADWGLYTRHFSDEAFGKFCRRTYSQWQERNAEVESHVQG